MSPGPVHPIEEESYRILAQRVDLSSLAARPAAVIARVIHATADAGLLDALVVPEAAVTAGVAALAAGAPVLCDVEMVRAGISGAQTHCHLATTPSAGDHPSRSAAAMAAAAARFSDGAVVVVGCAPTALAEACRLIERGELRPALVIGVPVGYVGAADAKERLLDLAARTGVQAIALRGERGGAAVAAAIVNALVRLAAGGDDGPGRRDEPSVLLIGHGTRSAAGQSELRRLCEAIASARPELAVESGYLELMGPGVDEAAARLVARGARQVIALPLVLLGAGHLKDDGPAALDRARRAHPEVAFSYARDLGVHPLALGAVEARCQEAAPEPGPPDAVVVVGRGSTDPDANANLAKVARLLADGRGLTTVPATAPDGVAAPVLGLVEPAFVSLARPGVAEALERCHLLGARRITVVPYFLCTGRLVVRLGDQARAWAADHPDTEVRVGEHIGIDERIITLVWSRYDEARGADVAMNCDACLYRVALPGYERRVGASAPKPIRAG